MKHSIAILNLITWTSICLGASQSNMEPGSLEGIVYAFHNPNQNVHVVWQSAVHSKKLILQMVCEERASNRIELDGNVITVDGKPLTAPISLTVAGGVPEQENCSGHSKTTYSPAQRFFVLQKYIGFWHTENPNKELQASVQALSSLAAVMKHVSKESAPTLVIDLNAWLDSAFGESRIHLPVIRIPQLYLWLYSDHSHVGYEDLTQEQYEQCLTYEQSHSIEHMLSSLHIN